MVTFDVAIVYCTPQKTPAEGPFTENGIPLPPPITF